MAMEEKSIASGLLSSHYSIETPFSHSLMAQHGFLL